MEVGHLQAVFEAAGLEVFEGFEDFGEGESELGAVAGAAAPAAGAAAGELDPDADRLADAQLLHVLHDQFELGELLDHRDDVLADLLGQHDHADELVVLEAVADDGDFAGAVGEGEDG